MVGARSRTWAASIPPAPRLPDLTGRCAVVGRLSPGAFASDERVGFKATGLRSRCANVPLDLRRVREYCGRRGARNHRP